MQIKTFAGKKIIAGVVVAYVFRPGEEDVLPCRQALPEAVRSSVILPV